MTFTFQLLKGRLSFLKLWLPESLNSLLLTFKEGTQNIYTDARKASSSVVQLGRSSLNC